MRDNLLSKIECGAEAYDDNTKLFFLEVELLLIVELELGAVEFAACVVVGHRRIQRYWHMYLKLFMTSLQRRFSLVKLLLVMTNRSVINMWATITDSVLAQTRFGALFTLSFLLIV